MLVLLDFSLRVRAFVLENEQTRHLSRESGNLSSDTHKQSLWMPIFAGRTKHRTVSKVSRVQREYKKGSAS